MSKEYEFGFGLVFVVAGVGMIAKAGFDPHLILGLTRLFFGGVALFVGGVKIRRSFP